MGACWQCRKWLAGHCMFLGSMAVNALVQSHRGGIAPRPITIASPPKTQAPHAGTAAHLRRLQHCILRIAVAAGRLQLVHQPRQQRRVFRNVLQ